VISAVVVVADVACPNCSQIARELPDLLRVPVTVRSCRDPRLAGQYPALPTTVLACALPALGLVHADGSVRWWLGLRGALGVLPVCAAGGVAGGRRPAVDGTTHQSELIFCDD
jgi:hypothetical protein